jgi:hypothetical protein
VNPLNSVEVATVYAPKFLTKQNVYGTDESTFIIINNI